MAKKKIYGECRICGEEKQLSEEHYIPRAAGGGIKIKLYTGEELLKTLDKDTTYNPRGKIKQKGLSAYTLCKECNELSGHLYDKEFARFYNSIHHMLYSSISIPETESAIDHLEGKVITLQLEGIKPFNVAKRLLVSFCSVEHPGLTERKPEIRRAILDKEYHPDTQSFALYMNLHLGNSAYYGTIATLKNLGGTYAVQAYAGIESGLVAFHYSDDQGTTTLGLENCTNITTWLTQYSYDQKATIRLELMFSKSLGLRFPLKNKDKAGMG